MLFDSVRLDPKAKINKRIEGMRLVTLNMLLF